MQWAWRCLCMVGVVLHIRHSKLAAAITSSAPLPGVSCAQSLSPNCMTWHAQMPTGTGKTITLLSLITSYQLAHPEVSLLCRLMLYLMPLPGRQPSQMLAALPVAAGQAGSWLHIWGGA